MEGAAGHRGEHCAQRVGQLCARVLVMAQVLQYLAAVPEDYHKVLVIFDPFKGHPLSTNKILYSFNWFNSTDLSFLEGCGRFSANF